MGFWWSPIFHMILFVLFGQWDALTFKSDANRCLHQHTFCHCETIGHIWWWQIILAIIATSLTLIRKSNQTRWHCLYMMMWGNISVDFILLEFVHKPVQTQLVTYILAKYEFRHIFVVASSIIWPNIKFHYASSLVVEWWWKQGAFHPFCQFMITNYRKIKQASIIINLSTTILTYIDVCIIQNIKCCISSCTMFYMWWCLLQLSSKIRFAKYLCILIKKKLREVSLSNGDQIL